MVGKTVGELGISAESMQNEEHGFHAKIEGKYYYCVFKKIETRYMGFIIPMDVLYERIPLDQMCIRDSSEGQVGCKTVFDVAPAYLHPESGEALRAKLL